MASAVCSLKIGLHSLLDAIMSACPIVAGLGEADQEGTEEMRRSSTHKGITARSRTKPVALEKLERGRLQGVREPRRQEKE